MLLSLKYKVTFKEAPTEPQQTATFPLKPTADAFAIAVERDGGIAIVTSEYEKTAILPTDFSATKSLKA